uniref:Uncharacterized protein n=1 Tax=Anguilla anguilla TaxID=7936 RepID=A0A0E9QL89_ANGAN
MLSCHFRIGFHL